MPQVHVPQFGKWDQAGDVPYTQYFDDARKSKKSGTLYNPNDPNANPEAFAQVAQAARAPAYAAKNDNHRVDVQQKLPTGSVQHRNSGRASPGDAQRKNSGRDRSFEQSPLQNQVPPRMKSTMDKRVRAEGSANGLNRQRRQGTRPGSDEMQDRAAAVPPFGEWEKNEEFTDIFDQLKQEKKTGVVSPVRTKQSYSAQYKKDRNSCLSKLFCCFGSFKM